MITDFTGQGVDFHNTVNLVAEVFNADDGIGRGNREYLNDIPADAEGTTLKINLASGILHVNQTTQYRVAFLLHAGT